MVSGKAGYYVNKHPLIIFLYAVNATIKKPHYTGVAVLYGYFMSLLKRESPFRMVICFVTRFCGSIVVSLHSSKSAR